MSKVNIRSHDGKTHIFIDGKIVTNVTSFKLAQKGNETPRLILEIVPSEIEMEGMDIEIEKQVVKS